MPLRYFDVVVLGMRLGALACAALLARRDFRVLVLGDGHRAATYRHEGLPLRRGTFAHLAAASPVHRRIVAELAQSQIFKRRTRPLDPMIQWLGPLGASTVGPLDVTADHEAFGRELDRVLPAVRASVEELHATLASFGAAVDEVLELDAVWPPGTFWERRETGRLQKQLPRMEALPPAAGYRDVAELGARFASHLASDRGDPLPAFVVARLHGAWTRGLVEVPGDEDELAAMFVERIRAHGGDVREHERCEAILHKRGTVRGVVLESDGEETGCAFVIGDRPSALLLERVRELEIDDPDPHPAGRVARRRFALSAIVRREVVPPPLARNALLRPRRSQGVEVHLQRASFATPEPTLEGRGAELLVAEALLDDHFGTRAQPGGDLRAREAILATLGDHLPFLERHVLVVDSPHDGGPLFSRLEDPARELRAVPRTALRTSGGSLSAELGVAQYRRTEGAYADLCGEPIRSGVDRLLTVSPSVVPALGSEGELLAAWGAARLVTRTDRKRERMRREMWSKIEI